MKGRAKRPDALRTRDRTRQPPQPAAPPTQPLTPPASSEPTREQSPARAAALIALVGLVVAVVHWPTLEARALSFDDTQYVTQNQLVLHPSWANAGRFLGEVGAPSTVRGYYQPLAMISLMADCALGGSASNLVPFHRTSLALHVLNAMLVATLLLLLFHHAAAAALGGLLWGLHPLCVEAIPWIGERKTPLAAFFGLLCLVGYVRWCQGGRKGWFAACAAFLVLALMSKPTTTPLPALMVLLDYWPLRRLSRRSLLEKTPLFLIAGISAVITVVSQGSTAHVTMPGQNDPSRIVYIVAHNIVFYLQKVAWPHDLSSHYPFPNPLTPESGAVLVGLIGSALLLALLWYSLRRTRALVVAWLFFFVAIFPTLGFIGFTNVIASDKYAYLPMVGFLLPIAALLARDRRPTAATVPVPFRGPNAVLYGLVLLACAAEAVGVRRQLAYWRTTEALFDRMIALAPRAETVQNNYGVYLYDEGKKDKALEHFSEAVRLAPEYADAHQNVGMVLAERGQLEEAARHYEAALGRPDSPVDAKTKAKAHADLAVALRKLGRLDESLAHCREAIRLDPTLAGALVTLGNTLRAAGRSEEALDAYHGALKLKGDSAGTFNNLGAALSDLKRHEDAIVEYRRACALDPSYAEPHANMALALEALGRTDEAMAERREALRLEPTRANERMKVAEELRRAGKTTEALDEFLAVVATDPGNAHARRNAAFHLQEAGRVDEAIAQYQAILAAAPDDAESRKNLAILHERQGKVTEAIADCREAVRRKADDAEAHFTLAWVLERHGDTAEAQREYEQVLQLAPAHAAARQRLEALARQ